MQNLFYGHMIPIVSLCGVGGGGGGEREMN